MGVKKVREFATEQTVNQAINFITKDPEQNLPKLLQYLENNAKLPHHKNWVKILQDYFNNNSQAMEQVKRVCHNPNMLKKLVNNLVIKGSFAGRPERDRISEELGVALPAAILIDPTSACNLRCTGCWAGEYDKSYSLEPELINRIIKEARDLHIHWIVFSGGEPLVYPHLFKILEDNSDSFFMSFTNGTLITEERADRLARLGNFSPAISLEGTKEKTDARRGEGVYDKILDSMDRLRERGVLFGASITVMWDNAEELLSDEFMDFLIEKGVTFIWAFHYVPIGRNPSVDMMLTPEQREWMIYRVQELRASKPVFLVDFWNDGDYSQGCIAGGRQYFYINGAGDVEPCAFVHFAVDNIKEKSLKEVLQNPFFKEYQRRIPFNENHLAPCPIIDAPQELRCMVESCQAYPTHEGAGDVLEGRVAQYLDEHSSRWLQVARDVKDKQREKCTVE